MKEKTKKKQLILICVAVLVVAITLVLRNNPGNSKSNIDIYVAPPAFGNNAYDYMRIQSEKATYNVDEEISLDVSCGFYLPPNGYGAETLSFDVACSKYMDISISVGDLMEYPGTEEEFVSNSHSSVMIYETLFFYTETQDFDADQLILKKGFLGRINKNSLQYHFTVTLKAKPDAPESFYGTVYIRVYDHAQGNSFVELDLVKEGNTIILIGK
jgi:hypothetical protein